MGIYEDVATLQTQMASVQESLEAMQDSIDALAASQQSDSGWLPITLNNGWSSDDYDTDVPKYRKIGKVVFLKGLVSCTASAPTIIATLPEGYRPATNRFNRFPCVHGQSSRVNIQVNASGTIADYNKDTSTSRTYICLNGISFLTD